MDLEILEKEVREFVFNKEDISISEQVRRIPIILNLIVTMYNKYNEELSVEEAYLILFSELEIEQ